METPVKDKNFRHAEAEKAHLHGDAYSLENSSVSAIIDENGFVCSKTVGVSMQPFIKSGRDTVVIIKKQGRLKKYDIALYTRPDGKLILHRVTKVVPEGYYIRGDNCVSGEIVPESAVLGFADGWYKLDKYLSCSRAIYKIESRLWNFIFPLRAAFRFCLSTARRVGSKIYRKIRPRQ